MKRKDIIQLVAAVVILAAAGFLIYNVAFGSKKASAKVPPTVEKIQPITSTFSDEGLKLLADRTKVLDFYNAPDLHTGLDNPQPFGPLK